MTGDQRPDDVFDFEPRFVCQTCGKRGAGVQPDWEMPCVDDGSLWIKHPAVLISQLFGVQKQNSD
jgi:hypothetical protein